MYINLFWFVLLPIILGVVFYLIKSKYYRIISIVFQAIFLGLSIAVDNFIVQNGTIIEQTGRWKAPIGIMLKADRINFIFVVLTAFIFLILFIYSYKETYFDHKFMFLSFILQGLLAGIFISNDLFNIYVLIEVSTIITTILITYNKDKVVIYDGIVYFLLNMVAMTFFLVALGFTYKIFGTLDIDLLRDYAINSNIDTKVLILPYGFFITAATFKCGLIFQWSWVTRAYATPAVPAVISMVLAGVISKSSFVLFYKLDYVFSETFKLDTVFMILGLATSLVGYLFAFSQDDLRKILAYCSISQMGLIIFAFHLPSEYSYYGSLYHSINHSIYKGLLFIILSIITNAYGTSNVRKIKGVLKEYPYVAFTLIIAMLSVSGAPFFNGSISKYFIAKEIDTPLLKYSLQLVNLGTILCFIKFGSILFGESSLGELTEKKKKLSPTIYISIFILALLCFFGGVYGTRLMAALYRRDFSIDSLKYLNKSILYFVKLILGIFFYKFLYDKIYLFKFIKEAEFDFRIMVSMIVLFFTSFTFLLKVIVL